MLKIGVLELERIEGPLDQIDAAAKRFFALAQLEPAPDSVVAILGQHAQHVAVQIGLAARLHAGNREAESDHASPS